MHSAKRIGLALAIVSAGWLAASAFRATGSAPLRMPARETPIRRELPMHIRSDPRPIDGSENRSPAASREPATSDEFPRLDRVPRIGQNKSE